MERLYMLNVVCRLSCSHPWLQSTIGIRSGLTEIGICLKQSDLSYFHKMRVPQGYGFECSNDRFSFYWWWVVYTNSE